MAPLTGSPLWALRSLILLGAFTPVSRHTTSIYLNNWTLIVSSRTPNGQTLTWNAVKCECSDITQASFISLLANPNHASLILSRENLWSPLERNRAGSYYQDRLWTHLDLSSSSNHLKPGEGVSAGGRLNRGPYFRVLLLLHTAMPPRRTMRELLSPMKQCFFASTIDAASDPNDQMLPWNLDGIKLEGASLKGRQFAAHQPWTFYYCLGGSFIYP